LVRQLFSKFLYLATMASIKYTLRSETDKQVPIYITISISRELRFREKTGLYVNPRDWSKTKGFPKHTKTELKILHDSLKKLESHWFNELNKVQTEGKVIDKQFIQLSIKNFFNRKELNDESGFQHQVDLFVKNASTKKVKNKGSIGLSENTIKNWNVFKSKVVRFEEYRKKTIHVDELSLALTNEFKTWSFEVENYSINTVGKDLAYFKQIAEESERKGISVHPQARLIESFTDNDEERCIVTMSTKELDLITNHHLEREALINARQWLLIGCELGQRGGDLLKVNFSKIRMAGNNQLIDIFQKKGGKWVTVPITPRASKFLSNGIPYRIAISKFNTYLKDLLEEVGFDTPIKGKKVLVSEEGRKRSLMGVYPKHELISTHSCRRSFATNYYKKMPTPIIMEITGHAKESTFLKYIGMPKDKDDNALLFLSYLEGLEAQKNNEQ
jgi:integrase-like protein/Arm domain-containing DNA-binding protein